LFFSKGRPFSRPVARIAAPLHTSGLKYQAIHDRVFFTSIVWSETPSREKAMLTLIRNVDVFSPEPQGSKDVLLADHKIAALQDPGEISLTGVEVHTLDASGLRMLPGLIDPHVHILGGGGEGGPTTRAPEIRIEEIIQSGVTTVIGCLGTDGITRHMESLLAKARSLELEGVTTYIFSGSYAVPVLTLTGSMQGDLVFIEKVIGAGEIALSDHRSSQPAFVEFARLAAECRVGGMLGGKAGVLHCHLGEGERRLEFLFRLLEETEIPPTQVIPTHVNRNPELLAEAIEFMARGGYVDITAGPDPEEQAAGHLSVSQALELCREQGAELSHITVSSDSNGSMPVFDAQGNLTGLTISTQESLLANLRFLLEGGGIDLPTAVGLFATNAAEFYRLANKGRILPGGDADLILVDEHFNLRFVWALGRPMMADGVLRIKGTFSP
jgi:beta-aspartyl-dipeptidase (metallo-type)